MLLENTSSHNKMRRLCEQAAQYSELKPRLHDDI